MPKNLFFSFRNKELIFSFLGETKILISLFGGTKNYDFLLLEERKIMISLFLFTNKPDFSVKEKRMLGSRCKLKERTFISLFCEEPKNQSHLVLSLCYISF